MSDEKNTSTKAEKVDVEVHHSDDRDSRHADETPVAGKAANAVAKVNDAGHSKVGQQARRSLNLDGDFNPVLEEPELPQNSLARLYASFARNDIEWKVYKNHYLTIAEKQADLIKEKADHIISKAKIIHERELEQLREVLTMHNSEVISGLQHSAHETTQSRLIEIAEDYVKHIQKTAQFPAEIRDVLNRDAAQVWDHARRKILKYALEQKPESGDEEDA